MIKKYFIAGLLAWVPLWVTVLVIKLMVEFFDQALDLFPKAYQPEQLIGFNIPGLGLILTFIVVFVTGIVVTHFLGQRCLMIWEKLLARIPLVRSIYNAVKQVMHTIFASKGDAFRKVLLVEYPRKGLWSIAFQTGKGFGKTKPNNGGEMVTVFVPTTPNPTSGFLIMVPSKDVTEMDITVDEALRMVVSLGIVLPGEKEKKIEGEEQTQ